jgi:hypothetical protein
MPTSPSTVRTGRLLLLLIAVGVVVGAAAVLLVGPTPKLPPAPSTGGELWISLPFWAVGLLALLPIVVGFAGVLMRRRTEGSVRFPLRVIAVVVTSLMVVLVLLLVFRGSGGGGVVYIITPAPPHNNTTSNTTNGTGTPLGGATAGTFWSIPAWAVAVGVAAVVGLGAVVGWLSLRPERGSGPKPPPLTADPEARAALSAAAGDLERGADPRTVILRLYARLLSRVGPWTGDLAPWTPEEIRVGNLAAIGLSGPSVEALTRLFEEARYSSHAMGPEAANRAVQAIRLIEREIDLRGTAS